MKTPSARAAVGQDGDDAQGRNDSGGSWWRGWIRWEDESVGNVSVGNLIGGGEAAQLVLADGQEPGGTAQRREQPSSGKNNARKVGVNDDAARG